MNESRPRIICLRSLSVGVAKNFEMNARARSAVTKDPVTRINALRLHFFV